jgi:hypothetical protein
LPTLVIGEDGEEIDERDVQRRGDLAFHPGRHVTCGVDVAESSRRDAEESAELTAFVGGRASDRSGERIVGRRLAESPRVLASVVIARDDPTR